MKIGIIGSGAIGCLYGAYLSKHNDVYMMCRRQKVADAINQQGITVFETDGTKNVYQEHVQASLSGECREVMDLLIVIVKGADTERSIETCREMIGPDTMVMTLQNGGGNDLVLSKYVPMDRIIIGTTRHNSVNLDNGNIRHSGGGKTVIGSNVKGADLREITKALEEAGFETVVSDNIQRIIWSKLFINLSVNTFTAITKTRIGSIVDNEYAWFFVEKMICEAIDVAEAEGQRFSYLEVLNSVHELCETLADGFTSMSQDVMNCRRTEVDAINGFVVDRAKTHNVQAPYNTFIRNLIHAIENTYEVQEKTTLKFAADDVILRQGEVSDCIYKVLHGSVSLFSDYGTDKEYLLGVEAVDKFFGEYSCFSGSPNLVSVVANEDTIVMEIPKADVHGYIAINPLNAESMLDSLSRQVAMMVKHIELLKDDLESRE